MDYEKEFKSASETIAVLDKDLCKQKALNNKLVSRIEQLEYECKRLKTENAKIKNATVEKYLGIDLSGEDE